MIDGHCHILPFCDDGAKNADDSINMLKAAKDAGINKIIFTSHIKDNYTKFQTQKEIYKKISPEAKKLGIQTALGAEVHWKKLSELGWENAKNLKLGNSNLFLLEFSYPGIPDTWINIVNKLKNEGFIAIIAHPERYKTIHDNFNFLNTLKQAGCLLMLSACSLNKKTQTKKTFKTAKKIIKKQLADIIASDAHSATDYNQLTATLNFAKNHNYNFTRAEKLLEAAF